MFVVVTVVTVPVGWIAYQLNWIRQRHELVPPDFPTIGAPTYAVGVNPLPFLQLPGDTRPSPPGMLWLFREPAYNELYVTFWDDEEPRRPLNADERATLHQFKTVFPEAKIIVRRGQSLEPLPAD